MNIAIFTTNTPHHNYFLQEITKKEEIKLVFFEKKKIKFKFKTSHPFEKKRNTYEKNLIAKSKKYLKQNYKKINVFSINDISVQKKLIKNQIDLIFVFGTGKIKKKLINKYKNKILNFHGGNPEEYRGLDSHLWSIYHSDMNNICSCLHVVDEKIDNGKIIFRKKINLNKNDKLYKLQIINTKTCVKIFFNYLNLLKRKKKIKLVSQKKKGKYYSAMPTCLKSICLKKFNKD